MTACTRAAVAVAVSVAACRSGDHVPDAQRVHLSPVVAQADAAVALEAVAADGQVRRWQLAALQAVAAPRAVRVWDPQEQAEVSFWAMPLAPLLDAMFGPAWLAGGDVLGVARDGYSAPIEVARLRSKPSWLAVARLDAGGRQQPLRLQPRGRAAIDAAPFYLVWDSLHDAQIRDEGDHAWPFQLTRLELCDLAKRYPQLAVAAAALPSEPSAAAHVVRGQQTFARYCLPCHAIAGSGGRVGPELVAPVGVVHTWQADWLAAWIDDPQQVRRDAKMPRPPLPVGDRHGHIADVIAYLRARTPPAQLPAVGR